MKIKMGACKCDCMCKHAGCTHRHTQCQRGYTSLVLTGQTQLGNKKSIAVTIEDNWYMWFSFCACLGVGECIVAYLIKKKKWNQSLYSHLIQLDTGIQ